MSKVERVDDLIGWQGSRIIVKKNSIICKRKKMYKNFAIKNQVVRCVLSLINTIAEGFCRPSIKAFINVLNDSQASVGELKKHLYVMGAMAYIDSHEPTVLQSREDGIRSKALSFIKNITTT